MLVARGPTARRASANIAPAGGIGREPGLASVRSPLPQQRGIRHFSRAALRICLNANQLGRVWNPSHCSFSRGVSP